jgi:hypothetical protein
MLNILSSDTNVANDSFIKKYPHLEAINIRIIILLLIIIMKVAHSKLWILLDKAFSLGTRVNNLQHNIQLYIANTLLDSTAEQREHEIEHIKQLQTSQNELITPINTMGAVYFGTFTVLFIFCWIYYDVLYLDEPLFYLLLLQWKLYTMYKYWRNKITIEFIKLFIMYVLCVMCLCIIVKYIVDYFMNLKTFVIWFLNNCYWPIWFLYFGYWYFYILLLLWNNDYYMALASACLLIILIYDKVLIIDFN